MLKKIVLLFLLSVSCLLSNKIDDKISLNKKILDKQNKNKKQTSIRIEKLAKEIASETKKSKSLEKELSIISNTIFLNNIKLKKSKEKIKSYEDEGKKLLTRTKTIENEIVDSVIDKYSISLSKKLINQESLKDIINQEKYELILDNAKDKILKSNLNYFKIENSKRKNNLQIKKLEKYISSQENKKKQFKALQKKQKASLSTLNDKHKRYKNILKLIIKKQNQLSSILGDLNILKIKKAKIDKLKESLKKEALKKKKKKKLIAINKDKTKRVIINKAEDINTLSKKELNDEIELNVKNVGSSAKGIAISNYTGKKTMAPLKSYVVSKKFGKYYDPVYKIKLFNESVSLKSKVKNAKVYNVLKGKVVYAKTNQGALGSVVIVKHSNSLHTVYSQLSNIPKSIKVGKWLSTGYVVGRVEETLLFQATKSNRYINPLKLFK